MRRMSTGELSSSLVTQGGALLSLNRRGRCTNPTSFKPNACIIICDVSCKKVAHTVAENSRVRMQTKSRAVRTSRTSGCCTDLAGHLIRDPSRYWLATLPRLDPPLLIPAAEHRPRDADRCQCPMDRQLRMFHRFYSFELFRIRPRQASFASARTLFSRQAIFERVLRD